MRARECSVMRRGGYGGVPACEHQKPTSIALHFVFLTGSLSFTQECTWLGGLTSEPPRSLFASLTWGLPAPDCLIDV